MLSRFSVICVTFIHAKSSFQASMTRRVQLLGQTVLRHESLQAIFAGPLVPEGDGMKDKFVHKLGLSPTSVRLMTCNEFIAWRPASKIQAAQYGVSQA